MSATRVRSAVLPAATISEADGVRCLHLGTEWVQGAMRIGRPRVLELEYIQRMMVWLLLRPVDAVEHGHAVQLGLGAAAITRFTHQVLRMRTTVIELNPSVIQACRIWFHLPADDARLRVVQGDAGDWIARAPAESIDALCVDIYDQEAAAPALDDDAFYAACRTALAEGGVMTVNLFGRDAVPARSGGRIARAFGADQVWQLAPTREGNTIVVAGRGVVVPDGAGLIARADDIQARWKLPARKWLRLVRPWMAGVPSPARRGAA